MATYGNHAIMRVRRWWPFVFALAVLCAFAPAPSSATVTSSTRTVQYTGSGGSTFTVTFPFLSSSHLRVTKTTIASGAAVVLTQGVGYTVTMPVGATNGIVTTTSPVTSDYTITIARVVPVTQATSFKQQGSFRPASHEEAFDKLTMIAQQLADGSAVDSDIDAAITVHEADADAHTGYMLLVGRAGGQVAYGGTAAGEGLTLHSTAHGTKGLIYLGSGSAFDDVNERLGLGNTSPAYTLDVTGIAKLSSYLISPSVYGSVSSGGNLSLLSTTNGTKGKIYLGSASAYDEVNGYLGIGTTSPARALSVTGGANFTTYALTPIVYGSTSSGGTLRLQSTDHATKGKIYLGNAMSSAYDEVNDRLGLGTAAPSYQLHVNTTAFAGTSVTTPLLVGSTSTTTPIVYGSSSSAGDLQLASSSHATKGDIFIGSNATTAAVDVYGPTHGTEPDEVIVSADATSFRDIGSSSDHAGISSTVNYFTAPMMGMRKYLQTAGATESVTATLECDNIFLASTDNTVISLPNAAAGNKGCVVTLVNSGADGAALISLSPYVDGASDDSIYGSCVGVTGAGAATVVQSSGTAGKDWRNTKATANKGDYTTIVSDGSAGWYIIGCVGEWASEP